MLFKYKAASSWRLQQQGGLYLHISQPSDQVYYYSVSCASYQLSPERKHHSQMTSLYLSTNTISRQGEVGVAFEKHWTLFNGEQQNPDVQV